MAPGGQRHRQRIGGVELHRSGQQIKRLLRRARACRECQRESSHREIVSAEVLRRLPPRALDLRAPDVRQHRSHDSRDYAILQRKGVTGAAVVAVAPKLTRRGDVEETYQRAQTLTGP